MLKKEDFVYFGKFLKPHGTKGEIGLQGDTFALGDGYDFVACDIDGIFVPFFFESVRPKNGDTFIAKMERMESAEEVRYLTNREAFIPRKWVEESDEVSLGYFIGFTATDKSLGNLGAKLCCRRLHLQAKSCDLVLTALLLLFSPSALIRRTYLYKLANLFFNGSGSYSVIHVIFMLDRSAALCFTNCRLH